jgi:hypothetical protein
MCSFIVEIFAWQHVFLFSYRKTEEKPSAMALLYRFALPKPKGGRNACNPILSEDVYKAKVRRPRKQQSSASDPFDGMNFGELKKHANQPSHIVQGLSYLQTNWHNNPNERRATTRSNRRR